MDRDGVSETVVQLLSKLLSTDAVSPVQRNGTFFSPASVNVLRLRTELHPPLLRPPEESVGREDALVSAAALVPAAVRTPLTSEKSSVVPGVCRRSKDGKNT